MSDQRKLSTLKLDTSGEFLDLSFYDTVLKEKSVDRMDYYLSRVTNNPAYSESLRLEAYNHFHPRFGKFCSLGEVSDSVATTPTSQVTVLESTSVKQASPSSDAKTDLTLTRLVRIISTKPNSDNLLKVLAWHLVMCNITFSNPMLDELIAQFRRISNLTFNHLIECIGSRYGAERARESFKSVYNKHVLGQME
jgi:hypothetical protein